MHDTIKATGLSTGGGAIADCSVRPGGFALRSNHEPAVGEIEERLLALWQAALDIEGLGVLDDFFELGGDSLMAVRLFAEIEATFGASPPASILLECPTVRLLARHLDGQQLGDASTPLVAIREQGARPPLYVAHAASGNVLFVRELLPYLDREQPLYGIQARGLRAGETPHDRFAGMAADYLAAIRKLQPRGPYRLAGYCIGSLIAFEMARQLRAAGEEVGLLVMIDPDINPAGAPWLYWRNPDLPQVMVLRELARAGRAARRRLGAAWQILRSRPRPGRQDQLAADTAGTPAIRAALRRALKSYRPLPYDGDITIFASTDVSRQLGKTNVGWAAMARRVDVIELAARHWHVFSKDLPNLGRRLDEILAQRQ
jgi:thioesterase domain-containing protein/acyl carrier protein